MTSSKSTKERDTHFQGSAHLLWQRLRAELEYGMDHGNLTAQIPVLEQIIARHDYDLVYHVFDSIPASYIAEHGDPSDCVKDIPDLTQWPDS